MDKMGDQSKDSSHNITVTSSSVFSSSIGFNNSNRSSSDSSSDSNDTNNSSSKIAGTTRTHSIANENDIAEVEVFAQSSSLASSLSSPEPPSKKGSQHPSNKDLFRMATSLTVSSSISSNRPRSLSEVTKQAMAASGWLELQQQRKKKLTERRYVVLGHEANNEFGHRLQDSYPDRFKFFNINWNKFPDGTDDITIEGFTPTNRIANEHILFFASFHNNDVALSQLSVLIVLLQSFIESLTIVLPYFPVATKERVEEEGQVATANTFCMLLSNLPSIGKPNRIMIYDIHTLQNRFYFHSATVPSLHSGISLLIPELVANGIDTICFPDDGAAKRFGKKFDKSLFGVIICGKIRDGNKRIVRIQDGTCKNKRVVIVDDLVQTGGTLFECATELYNQGATSVCAYTTHAVFPKQAWRQFCKAQNGQRAVFEKFWITNSVPTVTAELPKDDVFVVLDLLPQIILDLDSF